MGRRTKAIITFQTILENFWKNTMPELWESNFALRYLYFMGEKIVETFREVSSFKLLLLYELINFSIDMYELRGIFIIIWIHNKTGQWRLFKQTVFSNYPDFDLMGHYLIIIRQNLLFPSNALKFSFNIFQKINKVLLIQYL